MKIFSLLIIQTLLISLAIHGQSIERQVIASGGTSVISPLRLDYTIGEMATQTVSISDKVFTQGFQQPLYAVIPANKVFPYLVIYPNPTTDNAIARFVLPAPSSLTISIYDVLGQLIISDIVSYTNGEMQYIIKTASMRPGAYFVRFMMNNGSATAIAPLIKME